MSKWRTRFWLQTCAQSGIGRELWGWFVHLRHSHNRIVSMLSARICTRPNENMPFFFRVALSSRYLVHWPPIDGWVGKRLECLREQGAFVLFNLLQTHLNDSCMGFLGRRRACCVYSPTPHAAIVSWLVCIVLGLQFYFKKGALRGG